MRADIEEEATFTSPPVGLRRLVPLHLDDPAATASGSSVRTVCLEEPLDCAVYRHVKAT